MFVYQRVDIRSARKNQLRSVTVSVLGTETITVAFGLSRPKTGIMSRHIPWSHGRWMILRGQKHQNLVAYLRRTIPRETCQRRVPWPWDSYGLPPTNKRDKRRVAQLLPCNLLENTYWMWENLLESPLSLSHTQATEGGGSLLFLASLSTLERRCTSICQGATGYRRKVLKVV